MHYASSDSLFEFKGDHTGLADYLILVVAGGEEKLVASRRQIAGV